MREKVVTQQRVEKERQELEKRRERELQLKKEMERLREQDRQRKAEEERLAAQQRQQDNEIKKMMMKHNQHNQAVQSQAAPALPDPPQTTTQGGKQQLPRPIISRTLSLDEPTVPQPKQHKNSYEMTPDPVPKPSTSENYNINDLNSEDETDDEDAPAKKVPEWATGTNLKTHLIKNHFNPPKLDELFGEIAPIDLNELFAKKKARFNKRTSSAHWDSPILKPGLTSCRKVNVV